MRKQHRFKAEGPKSLPSAKQQRVGFHAPIGRQYSMLRGLARSNNSRSARNARIILGRARGLAPSVLAEVMVISTRQLRRIIQKWNEEGISGLVPRKPTGRPRKFRTVERELILELVSTSPDVFKEGRTTWSLKLLCKVLHRDHEITISREHLRQIIRDGGYRNYLTRTWEDPTDRFAPKPDPFREQKWERIQELKRAPVVGVHRYSFDTTGNHSIMVQPGRTWSPKGRPTRRPARYKRLRGTWAVHLVLDLENGELFSIVRQRKRAKEIIEALRKIRKRDPIGIKQLIIADCSPTHSCHRVRRYLEAHNQEFVFTAKYSSWMNPVERKIGDLQQAVVNNSDYENLREAARATHRFEREHNLEKRLSQRA